MKEFPVTIDLNQLTTEVLLNTKTKKYLIKRYQYKENIDTDIENIVSLLSKKSKYSKRKFNDAFQRLIILHLIIPPENKNLIFEYAKSLVLKKFHYHFYEEVKQ